MKKKYKVILVVIALIGAFWLALEPIVLYHVNKQLDNIEGYSGSIKDVDIYLLSGGVQIDSLRLEVDHGEFTKPFVFLPDAYFSVQWSALFHGAIVGEAELVAPEINFELEPNTEELNVSEEVDWVQVLKDLGKITLNRVGVKNGKVNFYDNTGEEKVHLYLNELNVNASNLATVEHENDSLPSQIKVNAHSLGDGILDLEADANLLKSVPDMDLSLSFTEVNLVAFNKAFQRYAKIDLEAGQLNFFTEMAILDSSLTGYVKPLMKNVKIIDWQAEEENVLRSAWEGLVGLLAKPIENNREDQIASKVPINGTLDKIDSGVWIAIFTLIKNAYINPLKSKLDESVDFQDAIQEQQGLSKRELRKKKRKDKE